MPENHHSRLRREHRELLAYSGVFVAVSLVAVIFMIFTSIASQ